MLSTFLVEDPGLEVYGDDLGMQSSEIKEVRPDQTALLGEILNSDETVAHIEKLAVSFSFFPHFFPFVPRFNKEVGSK